MKRRPSKAVGARQRLPAPAAVRGHAVFLVGFMGAGKTTVGRALGRLLGWEFEDLDDRIESREARTVAEIFRDSGEEAFRRAETAALRELIEELRKGGNKVVALGGGAFVQKGNATQIQAAAVPTVFLDAPVAELWARCVKQAAEAGPQRPLLSNQERFFALYEKRRKGYLAAGLRIETGVRNVEEIAREIADFLALKKSPKMQLGT